MKFYLQDSRRYVGNDVLWWAIGGNGYTSDLRQAEVYTREEALSHHQARETDIPWPCDYIQGKTRPAVDMQYINRAEALAGTGIVLLKPKAQKASQFRFRCAGCNVFMSAATFWGGECQRCGMDSRP